MKVKRLSAAKRVRKYAMMQQNPFTSYQCAEATGVNIRTVRARLHEMLHDGTIKTVKGGTTTAYIAVRPKLISPSNATGEHQTRNENCLKVWRALEAGHETAATIAEHIGISRQTVHRYLCAFRSLGFVAGKTYYEICADNPPDLDALYSYPKLEDIKWEDQ